MKTMELLDVPVNCEGIDDDWGALGGSHIAQSLYENEDDDGLLVGQAGVHGHINKVGLDRDISRYCTVKW